MHNRGHGRSVLVATLLVSKTSVMSTPNNLGLPAALAVNSADVDGLTAAKASMISVRCENKHCQCLCPHRSQTQAMPRIPGMSLIAERLHNKYGSAVFIRDYVKLKGMSICEEDDVQLITIEQYNAIIQPVCKPPNTVLITTIASREQASCCNSEISTVTIPYGDTQQQEQMVKR